MTGSVKDHHPQLVPHEMAEVDAPPANARQTQGESMSDQTRVPRAVLTATIARSVDQFLLPSVRRLSALGYETHVVTSPGPEIPQLRQEADQVHLLPMHRDVSLVADVRALWSWLRLLRQISPTVVLAGTPKASLLAMLASRILGVPRRGYFLLGLRLEGVGGVRRRVLAAMEWLTSVCSHVVIAVSPSLAREYRRLGLNARRPVRIPHHGSSHGVDIDRFHPGQVDAVSQVSLGLDPELPVVTFIGRLTADKGPDSLLRAVQRLARQGVPFQLLVVGAQDEPDSRHHLSALLDSPVRVVAQGHLPDVRPYLAASTLVVLPTRREGMPNVVLEAAAMAIPAVTTDATGAVDSVLDGITGLVVPVDDDAALAEAVRTLLADAELREHMGRAARERVARDFAVSDVADAVVRLTLGTAKLE